MESRRAFIAAIGGLACGCALAQSRAVAATTLKGMPMAEHERAMRLAIEAARGNPVWPFGAVILRAASGEVVARGVNRSADNPTFHGEIAALDDYVAKHGNRGRDEHILYTTAEPCSMCMSALVWAGIGGTVFGTSLDGIKRAGIDQIQIRAAAVIDASPFYRGELLGGVLAAETDALFMNRKRA